jgi:hypothetical protein
VRLVAAALSRASIMSCFLHFLLASRRISKFRIKTRCADL